ncbi:MAG: dTDP-4-dehydrorhamnose reductase [Acidimicrobiia bacterium]|nr:dTDP-4-dehydrorhamnose reductase [Acidimicrobiia bacterium]
MRVLVTGAGGQLGVDMVKAFRGHDVVGLERSHVDITDRDSVLGALGAHRPDAVVNCAAYTAVDDCEDDVETAYAVNALGVRWLNEGCEMIGAHLTHISTDYVFSGDKSTPYVEWDETGPRSAYGRTKLAGETEVAPHHAIVRTSWLCGAGGHNMVKTILALADSHPTMQFVDDQIGSPSFTDDIATVVRRLAIDRRSGVHHVTNQGAVSWYEFARHVLDAAGHDPDRVEPITTAELVPARPAPRPANSVLDNTVLRLAGLPLAPHFTESLGRLVHEVRQ